MSFPIFGYFTAASYLIPIAIGLINYQRLRSSVRIFYFYCAVVMAGVIIELIVSFFGINNHWIINIFRLFEIFILAVYCLRTINHSPFHYLIYASVLLFLLIWLFTNFLQDKIETFNAVDAFTAGVIQLVLSGILLFHAVHKDEVSPIKTPKFWIATGILIYNSGTVVVLALSNTLLEQGLELFNIAWHINWSLCIVSNLMYSYSFLLHRYE
jgi:hypothetical protein